MAGLKRELDAEILRVSGVEIRKVASKLRDANARMRQELKALRLEVAALRKEVKAVHKRPHTVDSAMATTTETSSGIQGSRPTAGAVRRLRKRIGLSQKDFARLLNVTPLTVYLWERQTGRLNLRSKAKAALYDARSLTVRQAAERLANLPPE